MPSKFANGSSVEDIMEDKADLKKNDFVNVPRKGRAVISISKLKSEQDGSIDKNETHMSLIIDSERMGRISRRSSESSLMTSYYSESSR